VSSLPTYDINGYTEYNNNCNFSHLAPEATMIKTSLLTIMMCFLCSCSLVNRFALRTTASVINSGSDEILTEGNWENFKMGAPANLKLLEGLWYSDQGNKKLLTLLIKGYSAYAFGVSETEITTDFALDELDSEKTSQSVLFYEKAVFYGEKYLSASGIKLEDFWKVSFPTELADKFDSTFSKKDYVALLYLGQAIGSSINLQRSNIVKMSFMNHSFKLIEWVCSKAPEIEHNSCQLFRAVLTASMPSVMGGSQPRARTQFKKMMKEMPYNLLVHLGFIQYHIIPMLEEDEYKAEMGKLEDKLASWFSLQLGTKNTKNKLYQEHREFNLFNAIAKKRFEEIRKVEKDIF